MIAVALVVASGCDRPGESSTHKPTAIPPVKHVADAGGSRDARPAADAAAIGVVTGAPASVTRVSPAIRCSECHSKMFDEWTTGAHARASRSPVFRRMRELANDPTCDRCHAPLASKLPSGDPLADEGVTCEVCHSIKQVEVRHSGAGFDLQIGDQTKYGPLCDAEDHYFHKMGCSPLHQRSELCAGCHLYYRSLPGGGELPVFTEYEEWRDGPYRARGVSCQSCHMPGARAEVATGAGYRDGVSNHGLLGARGDLRRRALKATAVVSQAASGRITLDIDVRNTGAGHQVPTGLPERRIVVRAFMVAPGGARSVAVERRLGRHLVDARGTPAPFYLATQVATDDRIPPKGSRNVQLVVDASLGGELRIEIVWRAIDRELATMLAIDEVEEILLLHANAPIVSGRPDRPRTIELRR